MKKIVFLFLLLTVRANGQQTPWVPFDNLNLSAGFLSVHTYAEIFAPLYPGGSCMLTNGIHADMVSGARIHMQPGFNAGGFSNGGYFHGKIESPPFAVVFLQPDEHYPAVGKYEKLEMGIQLPAVLDQQVNDFIANGTGGLNPFDPEQVSIEATFHYANQSFTVYGFYMDDFIRDPATIVPFDPQSPTPANWIEQPTNYHWHIRFAPTILGYWSCSIAIRVMNEQVPSYTLPDVFFQCVPSSNKGFLKKGNDDLHLAYSGTNESFFALGQNIAWNDKGNNDVVYFRGGQVLPNFNRLFSGGYLDVLDWISSLSNNGGNMVRVCNVAWSYELEYDALDNYANRMNRAWEMDRLFEHCEQMNIKITISFHDKRFGGETADPLFQWANNPYHLFLQNVVYPDDFLTNADAQKTFKKKLRYFMSRWGYSTSLGIFELMGEIDPGNNQILHPSQGTPVYHFDDLTITQELYTWHSIMLLYTKALLPYRNILTTSSYVNPARNYVPLAVFDLEDCDITSVHSYHNERSVNIKRYDEFNKQITSRGNLAIWNDKPCYFEEMGLKENSSADVNDEEGCSDINMHNSLWATSFMGGFGAGLPWWQWFNNSYRNDNYPALKSFFGGIDFQGVAFNDPDFWDDDLIGHSESIIETYYIRDSHADRVMGWVHNATYWWGNIDANCVDRNNNYMPQVNIDDDLFTATPLGLPQETKYEIHGMNNLSSYSFELFSTRGTGGLYATGALQSNIFGTLKPVWDNAAADWAYKAFRAGNAFRQTSELSYDTLRCNDDTIVAMGNYPTDTLHAFSYSWDFGNGVLSNQRNALVVYDSPGVYLVILVVSDLQGWTDTLKQYIVKPEPCQLTTKSIYRTENILAPWRVYPNPATDKLNIEFDSLPDGNVLIALYNINGQCYFSQLFDGSSSPVSIPVALFPDGVYFLRIHDSKRVDSKRIVIVH